MRSYANLPKADVILITHEHLDHLDLQVINVINAIRDANTVVITNGKARARMHCIIVMKIRESKTSAPPSG
jgi:L-ascorbate metabolism protein UlaG (beta-lactamase superfamily)